MALAYRSTASPEAASCCRRTMISELADELDDLRRQVFANGGVWADPVGKVVPSSCHRTSLLSASSNRTNAFRARSSTFRNKSSSAALTSVVRWMVGRRLDAALTRAVAAEFADDPMIRIAVFVNALASALPA